jgi:hypothetical protein
MVTRSALKSVTELRIASLRSVDNRDLGQDEVELAFTSVRTCYVCGKTEHRTERCHLRSKVPRKEWHINRVKRQQRQDEKETTQTESNFATATAFYDL